ncbi:MAG: hypothetical protein HZB81_00095, partial [Deltaproteobacteria bacterium]|nr:hypothetical protein [Deltaproteobacteria bacterium]
VNLTGSGLNAAFTPKVWDSVNNKWIATVDGSGTLSGGSYNGSTTFNGAAAGTIGGGTFSGTGAGVAQ